MRRLLEGGTRVAWGAKTIPEGGFQALPQSLSFPGGMVVGDSAGFVNVPALKGVHYAMKSGILAAEAAVDAVGPGRTAWAAAARWTPTTKQCAGSYIWRDLHRVRNARPAFAKGFYRGALAGGVSITTLGKLPPGTRSLEPDADVSVAPGRPRQSFPPADGTLVFDKLSSVYLSGNKTRDDAPSHIRVDTKVRREVAEAWVHMCPAQVYEVGGEASPAGNVVDVEVTASNCVQCGAISAKGGRLTPPEGGDGPEYTQM